MATLRVPALALVLGLAACQPAGPPWHGADLSGADYGQKWALTDDDGKPRTLADYRGKVVLVYFGFTHCPDICPQTLGHLRDVLAILGPGADDVRVLFVTVDAEHDTPEVLHNYVKAIDRRFIGLSGSAPALELAARDFKVYARKKADAPGISFEHAGFVYALDRQGKPRVLFGPEVGAQDMAADTARLLKE